MAFESSPCETLSGVRVSETKLHFYFFFYFLFLQEKIAAALYQYDHGFNIFTRKALLRCGSTGCWSRSALEQQVLTLLRGLSPTNVIGI